VRLWTYQPPDVAAALARGETVRGDWTRMDALWRGQCLRLARLLAARGLQQDDLPPVFAWHSWAAWQDVPNDEPAKLLLSEDELARGVVRLILDAPDDAVLLTSYTVWNELLQPDADAALWDALTHVKQPQADLPLDQAVQAALPRLEPAWVVSAAALG
jgi:hypothetical protein